MKALELYIYPIKSAAAQKLAQMTITERGPAGDREWLLVDPEGHFLTQRTVPQISQILTVLEKDSLTIGIGKSFFKMSLQNSFQRRVSVQVWGDQIEAALEPDLYSQALSQFLGTNCRLVRHAPYSKRSLNSVTENWQPELRFADSRPLLLANTKSLQDLNTKLSQPIEMNRFRPNIVVEGSSAFEEDSWQRIQVGEVVFSQPKPCARCKIINIDPSTGQSSPEAEPLKTLSTYRRKEKAVAFGVLWIPENSGTIRQGDPIKVLASTV
jgi:uncharacterized protein YcbX